MSKLKTANSLKSSNRERKLMWQSYFQRKWFNWHCEIQLTQWWLYWTILLPLVLWLSKCCHNHISIEKNSFQMKIWQKEWNTNVRNTKGQVCRELSFILFYHMNSTSILPTSVSFLSAGFCQLTLAITASLTCGNSSLHIFQCGVWPLEAEPHVFRGAGTQQRVSILQDKCIGEYARQRCMK